MMNRKLYQMSVS